MSPPTENAPPKWCASESNPRLAAQEKNRNQTTSTARLEDAQARAGALCIATSATAAGIFEASQSTLEATAVLASSLAFDLWVAVSS